MFGKQVVKYIEDGEAVEGEVVNEGREAGWNPFKWWGELFGGTHGIHFDEPTEVIDAVDVKDTYNVKGHPDYQYQINYDESNNGYWDGHG